MKRINKTFRFGLLAIIAIGSLNVSAGEKQKNNQAKEEPMPELQEWRFSPLAAEEFPAKSFEKIWLHVAKSFGYPKSKGGISDDGVFTILWADETWLSANFTEWEEYDKIKKFYLAGVYTRVSAVKDREVSAEEYKSKFIANYQCVNAMTDFQVEMKRNGFKFSMPILENFKFCGLGRI